MSDSESTYYTDSEEENPSIIENNNLSSIIDNLTKQTYENTVQENTTDDLLTSIFNQIEDEEQEKTICDTFDYTKEQTQKKIEQLFPNNTIYQKYFIKIWEYNLEKYVKERFFSNKTKLSEKQNDELINRQKHILFNCIRRWLHQPIKTFEQEEFNKKEELVTQQISQEQQGQQLNTGNNQSYSKGFLNQQNVEPILNLINTYYEITHLPPNKTDITKLYTNNENLEPKILKKKIVNEIYNNNYRYFKESNEHRKTELLLHFKFDPSDRCILDETRFKSLQALEKIKEILKPQQIKEINKTKEELKPQQKGPWVIKNELLSPTQLAAIILYKGYKNITRDSLAKRLGIKTKMNITRAKNELVRLLKEEDTF